VDPAARFADLVDASRASVPLDEAALLIAACAHEGLSVDDELARLDALAAAVPTPAAAVDVEAVRRHLYVEHGFAGNAVDYYDPRNSFLNDVLTRRTGIPITLAVVLIEVARRCGVALAGVGMPAHFLVRAVDDPAYFVDPFDGVALDEDGCRRLFVRVAGTSAAFDPSFLDPVPTRTILARMLANLRSIYASTRDVVNLAWVLRLRLALPDTAHDDERLELSRVLAAAGRPGEAADELLVVASSVSSVDGARAEELEREAVRLRSRLN
jgi:regulator of sirC expression with transglutaminase-like and TPR domain